MESIILRAANLIITIMQLLLFNILYKLKAKLPFFWYIIETINSFLFKIYLYHYLVDSVNNQIAAFLHPVFTFRFLTKADVCALKQLLDALEPNLRKYFEVHEYTIGGILNQFNNNAFIMLGAFHDKKLVGYFFLRAGVNKSCFVGRLVHKDYRNKGVGSIMSKILHNAAWNAGFRVYATISLDNALVLNSHRKKSNIKWLMRLPNNYFLIEFLSGFERVKYPNGDAASIKLHVMSSC